MKKQLRQNDAFHPVEHGGASGSWRARVHEVIFGIDTPAGRAFDIGLVVAILLSILVVVLDSVRAISGPHAEMMYAVEWFFTLLFTLEYGVRLATVRYPLRYAISFYGLIDLLSVIPTYISLLVPGSEALLDIRILRLLRVFRIFKLTLYIEEYTRLGEALAASRRKIMVFLSVVLMAVLILGTVMSLRGRPADLPASLQLCTGRSSL